MTSNQIEAMKVRQDAKLRKQDLARKDRELDETKRRNKAANFKDYSAGIMSALNPLGNILKTNNDPSWYDLNPDATKAVANLSFKTPLGVDISSWTKRRNFSASVSDSYVTRASAPGIMTLPFVPTLGTNSNTIRVAANKIYAYVRHYNSGSRNYEAVDYMLFLLATDSIVSNFSLARKIFAAYYTFNNQNLFLGKGILRSIGFTEETISDEIGKFASLQAKFELLLNQFNSFNVPAVFNYIVRHSWLSGVVVSDEPNNPRAQIYHFMPRGYYSFLANSATSEEAGALRFTPWNRGDSDFSLEYILDIIQEQIQDFMTIEDFGIMSGDSLKAFGDINMLKIPHLDPEQILIPGYSEEVLSQVASATTFGEIVSDTASFYQKGGIIYQGNIGGTLLGPQVTANSNTDSEFGSLPANDEMYENDYRLINTYREAPEPRENMVSLALTACHGQLQVGKNVSINYWWETPKAYGSELIVGPSITWLGSGSAVPGSSTTAKDMLFASSIIWDQMVNPYNPTSEPTKAFSKGILNTAYSSFNWAPQVIVYTKTSTTSGGPSRVEYSHVTMKNYAEVSSVVLTNIHDVAILSMFEVNDKAPGRRQV